MLLLGGSSGAGKSTVAPQIARHYGIPWLEADDFRLAMQRATTPASHPALHFFLTNDMAIRPDFWQLSPEAFRDGLIAVGEVVSQALEIVVANHVGQGRPVVLEGDGILPALAGRRVFSGMDVGSTVRGVFLVEPDPEALLANVRTRAWDVSVSDEELRDYARANWLYRGAPRDFLDVYTVISAGLAAVEDCWAWWQRKNEAIDIDLAKAQVLRHLSAMELRHPMEQIPADERENVVQRRRWFRESLARVDSDEHHPPGKEQPP